MSEDPTRSPQGYPWAEQLSATWFLDPAGMDRLAVDGLAVGPCLRVEAFAAFMSVARDHGGDAPVTGDRRLAWLRVAGRDRAVRMWTLRSMSWGRLRRGSTTDGVHDAAPIVFLSELATPSTMEPSLAVARALPRSSFRVATADPRSHRIWKRAGHAPEPLIVPIREQQRLLARTARLIEQAWEGFCADPGVVTFGDHDVTSDVLRVLEPIIRTSVPWLGVERRALIRMLDAWTPRQVVVASDQHRIGRLAASLRPEGGWRMTVLQHGLPQEGLGYVPVVADTVAVWGPRSTAWFVTRGTDNARLVETGNPRLDPVRDRDRTDIARAVGRAVGLTGRPNVLLALSANTAALNARVTGLAIGVLRQLPEATLVVKLHPGGGDWSLVRSLVGSSPDVAERISVRDADPMEDLLAWADIVLVHRSSVAVDAMAHGIPVVVADIDGRSVADLDLPFLGLERFATVDECTTLVRRIAIDGGHRAYIEDRRARLEEVTGPLDGRAAARIADLLLSTGRV